MRGDGNHRGAESPLISRRVLLAVSGAVLLTGTGAAVAGERGSPTHRPADQADAPSKPSGARSATSPPTRHPEPTQHQTRPPRHEQPKLPYGEPMYTVDEGSKVVALTIDDGPSPVYTPQILAILRRYGVTASFSMIGRNVAAFPA